MSDDLFRLYTPKDALNFLKKDSVNSDEIMLLRNLKEMKENYTFGNELYGGWGYFLNPESAVLNPNTAQEFVDESQSNFKFVFVNVAKFNADGSLTEDAEVDDAIIDKIQKYRHTRIKIDDSYRYSIPTPRIEEVTYSSVMVDNYSICRLSLKYPDIYSRPERMANYSAVMSDIATSKTEIAHSQYRRGADFSVDGYVIFDGIRFKVNQKQWQAIKNLYDYCLEHRKPANHNIIFKNVDYQDPKQRQMSSVIYAVDLANRSSGHSLHEFIIDRPKVNNTAYYEILIPSQAEQTE